MKTRKSFIIGIILTILLLVGAVVAYYLSQKPQEVRQHAGGKPFGKAAVFDGQTELKVSAADVTINQPPYTVEFWAKPEQMGDSAEEILSTDTEAFSPTCKGNLNISISPLPDNQYSTVAELSLGGSTTSVYAPGSLLNFGQWTHFAVTVDSTTNNALLFLNGKLVAEATLDNPQKACINSNLIIGGGNFGAEKETQLFYKGELDELRFSRNIRYVNDFTPSPEPFAVDGETLSLWRFDGTTTDELTTKDMSVQIGTITYVDSDLPISGTTPACQPNVSTCEWDAVDTAVSYHYIITQAGKDTPIAEGDVQAPATGTTFVSEDNATYTCTVTATNVCGTSDKASATATCSVPTATPTPLPSSTPTPTSSPTPTPTSTPSPTPTTTPVPPTPTKAPTPTKVPPTPTSVPPTATAVPPTPTGVPPVIIATNTPTPTLPSPGSPIETITITGGILLTIIGAVLLFAL